MREPILVIMAAGMGSRYGGLKQMDPMGDNGELIIDFSLYDAWRAGFQKAVFIIKREMEQDFRAIIDAKAGKKLEVAYVFQELSDIPEGFSVPDGRVKPWGTGHAVLAAKDETDAPFAVINADDFYGAEAFAAMYQFLKTAENDAYYNFCMTGYDIENTLTENGHVARGVCTVDSQGYLQDITERTRIQRNDGVIQFTEDEGQHWSDLMEGTPVSMNLWGFTMSMMKELQQRFPAFLKDTIRTNPQKGEYFLPFVVDELIQENKARVKVLRSADKWYGVTYKEDKQMVMEALGRMKKEGKYPQDLWK